MEREIGKLAKRHMPEVMCRLHADWHMWMQRGDGMMHHVITFAEVAGLQAFFTHNRWLIDFGV